MDLIKKRRHCIIKQVRLTLQRYILIKHTKCGSLDRSIILEKLAVLQLILQILHALLANNLNVGVEGNGSLMMILHFTKAAVLLKKIFYAIYNVKKHFL